MTWEIAKWLAIAAVVVIIVGVAMYWVKPGKSE